MPNILLPFRDVHSKIGMVLYQTEALISKIGRQKCVTLLLHVERFAVHQFGKNISQAKSYSRNDGNFSGK
jgi:hypothetical protein